MEEGVRFRLALEHEISPALEAGELTLVFQPVFDLASARVTAAEALLRWNHPVRGGIPPSVFIKVAEECGAITAIGRFVLRQACGQLRQWLDAGLSTTRMAVNISSIELLNPDFESFVREVLKANALSPGMLELEITESIFIEEESDTVVALLHSLRSFGVRLSIDDFGTRYSTLSYLSRLPIDTLKIDRSFVMGLPDDAGSIALTRSIIVLAQNLGLDVIAEGVETAAQAAFLFGNGCQRIQGYHLSVPVSSEEFPETVRRIEQEMR
jgi:EAL domain-containing protein (putative c-di-GMP-specific phosphodiesterase class I)